MSAYAIFYSVAKLDQMFEFDSRDISADQSAGTAWGTVRVLYLLLRRKAPVGVWVITSSCPHKC